MSHTTPPIPSRNPSSTNGPVPKYPPPVAPTTTIEKFLGIPTTTSVHFACTLFTLVETLAFTLSGIAGASYDSPCPLAVPLFAVLCFLLLWHQRRCVWDFLLTRSHPVREASFSAATAEAMMNVEGQEVWKLFTGFQAAVHLWMAFFMLVFNCWVGHAGAAIVAGALVSGVGFLGFLAFCREVGPDDVSVGGKKGGEEREEQPKVVEEEESTAAAAPPPSTPKTGRKQPDQHLHPRLSCISEEDGADSSERGGDNHSPADLVLSQEAQDLVWNRARFLAARKTLRERRQKKSLLRRTTREMQGKSTPGRSGDDGFPAMPADSAQRTREEDSERTDSDRDRDRDRQGEVEGGLRKGGERIARFSGETRNGDMSVTLSSRLPLLETMPMGSNSIFPVPQQQTFPAMEILSHLPAAMDRTDPQQQRQQQAWHAEAMTRLARAKDAEIAALRTQMAGMTRYFRTREEAYRAAHAAEVANAWRNAQVLFEKVGKLGGMLNAERIARKGVEVEQGEWIWNGKIEQEERIGRKLGIFAQDEGKGERWVGVENDSFRKRRQQQQQKEEVVEEEGEDTKQDLVINLPLCQNAGCFCHFPVVPQQPQKQQPQEGLSRGEQEGAITSHDHVDGLDEDATDDDDVAFTIILDSDPPSSPSSSSSHHNVESPNTPLPPDGGETPLCQNADCFCHFPVVVRPYLPHTGQTGQRKREQKAQNDERRPIVPDHGNDAGRPNRNERAIQDSDDDEDDEEEDGDEAFTIISKSGSSSLPSSSSSHHSVESPEALVSVEGSSEMTLSEWERDSDFDFDSDSEFDALDERIHA
ncbi:hypothetical protein NU219Hw_g7925t1 [Hortaea werneckii]